MPASSNPHAAVHTADLIENEEDLDKFVFCGKCRKLVEKDDTHFQSLGVALDQEIRWHNTCFKCEDCGASLLDVTKKKAEIDEKLNKHNLYCGTCYLPKFAPSCSRCKCKIANEENWEMFGGTFHHASCFKCESCENSLADRQVVVSEGVWLCGTCHEVRQDFGKGADDAEEDMMKQLETMIKMAQQS